MKRVFIAVEISEEARRLAAERIEFLRRQFPALRVGWDKPEKLHLTLKFIGDADENRLEDLTAAAETAVQGIAPFSLAIAGAGAFEKRVLWLGVRDAGEDLKKLNERLEAESVAAGFPNADYEFKPHLTLARLKEPDKSRELVRLHLQTDFPAVSFPVEEITIFQSQLQPGGSVYSPLVKIKLTADELGG